MPTAAVDSLKSLLIRCEIVKGYLVSFSFTSLFLYVLRSFYQYPPSYNMADGKAKHKYPFLA
jgi:hypothetical protein